MKLFSIRPRSHIKDYPNYVLIGTSSINIEQESIKNFVWNKYGFDFDFDFNKPLFIQPPVGVKYDFEIFNKFIKDTKEYLANLDILKNLEVLNIKIIFIQSNLFTLDENVKTIIKNELKTKIILL